MYFCVLCTHIEGLTRYFTHCGITSCCYQNLCTTLALFFVSIAIISQLHSFNVEIYHVWQKCLPIRSDLHIIDIDSVNYNSEPHFFPISLITLFLIFHGHFTNFGCDECGIWVICFQHV